MGVADFEELTVGGNKYNIYATSGMHKIYPWVGEVLIVPNESKPMLWSKDGIAWNNSTYDLVPRLPEEVYAAGLHATAASEAFTKEAYKADIERLRAAIQAAVTYDRRHRK